MKKTSQLLRSATILLIILLINSCQTSEDVTPTPPSCSDGIKNQDEIAIDCGGSCEPCPIQYPDSGTFGLNILHGSDTLLLPGTGNSFKAVVPVGSSLKIEMYLISGASWGYSHNNVGWSISGYSDGKQTFDILNPGTSDVSIVQAPCFPPPANPSDCVGVILIKFFENSTTETRRKIIVWN